MGGALGVAWGAWGEVGVEGGVWSGVEGGLPLVASFILQIGLPATSNPITSLTSTTSPFIAKHSPATTKVILKHAYIKG